MTVDSKTEVKMDPWILLIEESKQRDDIAINAMQDSLVNTTTGLDEQSTKEKDYSNIVPKVLNSGIFI